MPILAPAIEVRNLTKRFGDITAVDDLSFAVQPGSVTGFLGPNGAGKTTTLRMLLGLVQPASGVALIGGRPYRQVRDHVGASLEATGFNPGRTARDHLRTRALARGLTATSVDAALALAGLAGDAHRRTGAFSLGMKQRLGLAAALLGDPRVLILDEPANGLDPEGVKWLRGMLRGLAAEGRTVLVSSHILAEVSQTVDHVVIVNKGRKVADAPLGELLTGEGTLEDLFLGLTGKDAVQ
jgi:ABC-2 type transport system ATP-binding protein